MSGAKEIKYKGEKIFLIDNTGLEGDDVIKNTALAKEKIINSGNKEILLLLDMTGVVVTRKINIEMTQLGKEILQYVKKNAILGMAVGAKKWLVLKFIKSTEKQADQKLFHTVEEAKNWLIKN
jgi:hypothetical protein